MSELTYSQTATEFFAIMQQEFSSRQLILACKTTKCWWDVLNEVTYEFRNRRTGKLEWHQRQRCLRCGSTRIARCAPRLPLTRLSKNYKYERPPGWYDERIYWDDAHAELAKDLKKADLFKVEKRDPEAAEV
jgi:hypothetical protein